jgi:hypothetical protein
MKQHAIIDVNMLADTRLGAVRRIDETIANVLGASNVYRDRHHDNFDLLTNGQIDRQEYQSLYAKQEADTLGASKMTEFVYYLRKDMVDASNRMERGAGITSVTIDINLFPYTELTDTEIKIFVRAVRRYFPHNITVNAINVPWAELTPEIVARTYDMIAIYNHEDWLIPNEKALIARRLPNVVMLTPTIATSGELPEKNPDVENPFSARSMVLVKFIALTYIPTAWACHNPIIHQEIQNQKHRAKTPPNPAPQV